MTLPGKVCIALMALMMSAGAPAVAKEPTRVIQWGPDMQVTITDATAASTPGRVLAALETASGLIMYSMEPWHLPERPATARSGTQEYEAWQQLVRQSRDAWCERDTCLADHRILGKVAIQSTDRDGQAAVKDAIRKALDDRPDVAAGCIPEYHHAIEFHDGRKLYQILLCYSCGQVAVLIDGKPVHQQQTWDMGDGNALDEILARAGIPLAPRNH